jgi:hypothetical protein
MKWRVEKVDKSLFAEMKKNKHPSLKIGKRNTLDIDSSLLKDVKEGKRPEDKHVTLDNFLYPNSVNIISEF